MADTNNIDQVKNLFLKYITLQSELDSKGGNEAVVENPDLEELYESILEIKDEIFELYGLPKLIRFNDIIEKINTENDFDIVAYELTSAAEKYLSSSPRKDIDLLEDAKKYDLKTYEVLPELGIEPDLAGMFYLEECFKIGKINAEELLRILKSLDSTTISEIGHLHYDAVREQNPKEVERLFKILQEKQIPFLEELRNYKPVYPY